MSDLVTDPNDPRLGRGSDTAPVPQNSAYLVLSEEEIAKGYVKPYRNSYKHKNCRTITTMSRRIAETYAANPWFYGSTYCTACSMHLPLEQFTWEPDGESMAPNLQRTE